MTPDERGFLEGIMADPDDDQLRLVYADWLDENGDDRADYVREEIELEKLIRFLAARPDDADLEERGEKLVADTRRQLRHFGHGLDPEWLAVLSRLPVENRTCDVAEIRFEFECPLRWEHLKTTDDAHVRECSTCNKPVYYCSTVAEAVEHARRRECVAVDARCTRRPGDLPPVFPAWSTVGLPAMEFLRPSESNDAASDAESSAATFTDPSDEGTEQPE